MFQLKISLNQKLKIVNLFFLFFVSGCGFSSGLYEEILEAQESISDQKYQKAVGIYEKILQKKPSKTLQIKIHYQLGELYSLYLNKFGKAIDHFNAVLNVTDELLWIIRSTEKIAEISFEDTRDYSTALKNYKKLMNFKPELENIDFYRIQYARSLLELHQYKEVVNFLESLISDKTNSISPDAYYLQGLSYFYLRKTEKAIGSWFEFLKREKRSDKIVQAKFMIANAYESTERLKEAYNIYYSILGDYPNPEVIKHRLDAIYKRRVARKR